MSEPVDRRTDIVVALALIVICAIVLFESRDLPPGTFEPLGSAPVPQATAGLIILLCAFVIAKAALTSGGEGDRVEQRYLDAGAMVLLTVVYVAAIHLRLATFAILTSIYLIATIGVLTRFRIKTLPAVIITALITAFGSQYVFTRIFIVDLPGL